MDTLHIDIESFSRTDLTKTGVYRYVEDSDFEILLFSYSINGGDVNLIDLKNGEKLPDKIIEMIKDENTIKWAFNANFERICLSRHLGIKYLNPKSWRCTRVWAAYLSLPLSLEQVGDVLKLDKKKIDGGKNLIKYFSMPARKTIANGKRDRNLPHHDVEKWELFKEYNIRDVQAEMEIKEKLSRFKPPESLWDEYHMDQIINDRGIEIDIEFVESAIDLSTKVTEIEMKKLKDITKLDNPNSVMQLKAWLKEKGVEVDSLNKKAVDELIENAKGDVKTALEIRAKLSKSSVKKYMAMKNAVNSDGRLRGSFQFYGANRTGRFAGRIVQMQNLPRNYMGDLKEARELVRQRNFNALSILYDSIPDVLSELIRTAFIPKKNNKFIVSDFSAIEARVIAFLANEKWRLDVFEKGGDIYCQSASNMFGVKVVKNGINSHLRQKGKIAELACIAEGELVLTDKGLTPIENVKSSQKVWDGENWVNHGGVIYKGEGEIINYDGLKATKDHLVWIKGRKEPIPFEKAKRNRSNLVQTADGIRNLHLGENVQFKKTENVESGVKVARLYDIRNAGENNRFTVSGKLVHNCGYGGSVGALKAMGALEMGLSEDELRPLVNSWRLANSNITRFWWAVDRAVKTAVKEKVRVKTHGLIFSYQSGMLIITLPSNRSLFYIRPRITENKFGGESVSYEGIAANRKWALLESYGPKFVENIVQAISRDLLCFAMNNLKDLKIVAHVHDEIIIEADLNIALDDITKKMSESPPWLKSILLAADGFESAFYKKD